MAKEIIPVEVEKSAYEVVEHSAKIVKAIKEAMKDGFQAGQDIPVAVSALIAEFPTIMANVPNLGADLKEDKIAFIKGANLGAYEFVDAFMGSEAPKA